MPVPNYIIGVDADQPTFSILHSPFSILIKKGDVIVAKNLEVSYLLDFYGEVLTQKQHDFLVYYYDEDLSLSEIAENEGITRQGVRDAIKRAEAQLFDMEKKLGVAAKFGDMAKGLDEIKSLAQEIYEYNLEHSLSREINDNAASIISLAEYLKQQ